jgi:hypothetical protein
VRVRTPGHLDRLLGLGLAVQLRASESVQGGRSVPAPRQPQGKDRKCVPSWVPSCLSFDLAKVWVARRATVGRARRVGDERWQRASGAATCAIRPATLRSSRLPSSPLPLRLALVAAGQSRDAGRSEGQDREQVLPAGGRCVARQPGALDQASGARRRSKAQLGHPARLTPACVGLTQTGTAKACWICYKETTTVLASASSVDRPVLTVLTADRSSSLGLYLPPPRTLVLRLALDKADFLYVCPSHLTDRNFATSLAAPTPPADAAAASGPTKEQIAAVIAEYEARKGKDKDKAKSADDKEKGDGKKAESPGAYLTPSAPAPAPMPTHNVFALHRDFYAMRLAELRKRDNLVKVRRTKRCL